MEINWTWFIAVMIVGEGLLFLQALLSFQDGFFSANQMYRLEEWHVTSSGTIYSLPSRDHLRGYSFLQHGGMWFDVIVITPLVAYLVGKYRFEYISMQSIEIAVVSLVVWTSLAVFVFTPAGKIMPEAHTHDGHVTEAGWILVVYATLASWVIAMVYIKNLAVPAVSKTDIATVSGLLVPWAITGVMKFTPKWKFTFPVAVQTAAMIAGVAILAWWRLW